MLPANYDIYSLESWLREKALEAHNKINNCKTCELLFKSPRNVGTTCPCGYKLMEGAFNETIAKIQSGRVNQRPHVSERI